MQNRRPPIPVIILLLLAIAAAGYYFLIYRAQTPTGGQIKASGAVEATEVSIAPELSGKITAVNVQEGDSVKAGDTLFSMDPAILNAQQDAATAAAATARAAVTTTQAAVAAASTQYDQALAAALTEDQSRRIADWTTDKPSDFKQPSWYYDLTEQLAAYQDQLKIAQVNQQKAADDLNYVEKNSTSQAFLDVENRLLAARLAYQVANTVLDRATNANDGQEVKDAAQTTLDDAKTELDNAQRLYDTELSSESATKVLQARAKLQVARENTSSVEDHIRAMQTGVLSLKVVQAQKTLDQAKAAESQAETAVKQADSNLALLAVQIQKLTAKAPTDGVVITRSVEPGEVANPGATVLVLARLSDLTITVYIPEDRYGEISMGQKALVSVDSFPGQTFQASVVHIADKAEFTPRNVQTADGRKSTVFAIKLKVEDTGGKLKYGMPADVIFQ